MGSLSEYLNTSIDAGIKYSGDIIRVLPRSSVAGPASGAIAEAAGDKLKSIPHIKSFSGGAITQATEGANSNPFSAKYILGLQPAVMGDAFGKIPLESGRLLQDGDEAVAVIGHNIAAEGNLKVGSVKELRGLKATVVGIFKPTQSNQIDDFAVVPLKKVQELNNTPGIVNLFIIVPDDPSNAEGIAKRINNDFGNQFNALSPSEIKKQVQQGVLIFNIIILAGAALAALVGGLATINTMIMSVAERTREIGIKKAIGASNTQIMREFLIESALIGLVGGLVGVGVGKIATIAINVYTKANLSGLEIFNLTPRLAIGAVLFATILGALAGLIPAISASRMNVVKALRSE